jgi:O-antigen ligase
MIKFILIAIFIAIPWLSPFGPGPSFDAVSWLVSLGSVGALILIVPNTQKQLRIGGIFFVVFCAFLLLHWRFAGGRYGFELIGMLAALMVFWGAVLAGLGMTEGFVKFQKADEVLFAKSNEVLHCLAFAWLFVAVISSAIGLFQYFGVAKLFSPWLNNPKELGSAFANLRQRNLFATLTGIGLISLLGIVKSGWFLQSRFGRFNFWLVYGAIVILALGNAASGSRTGLLEWMLILVGAVWWDLSAQRKIGFLALKAVIVYLLANIVLPWILYFATGFEGVGVFGRLIEVNNCESRKLLWVNVLKLILERPWMGWGWGELDYAQFITLFGSSRVCKPFDNAHNLPLHLAVEFGIPAALVICVFFCWLVWRAKPWRDTDPIRQMMWGVLGLIFLHSLLEFPLWYGSFQIAFGICVGVLWGSFERSSGVHEGVMVDGAKRKIFLNCLSIAFLMISVSAGFGYYRVRQAYLPLIERDLKYQENTVKKVQNTLIFSDQARLALLMNVRVVNSDNALMVYELAKELLHYSPEPRVIERVIEVASILRLDDDVKFYKIRYKEAFPDAYDKWLAVRGSNL